MGIAVAVLIGAAVRLWYTVGFVGGNPQDDGIYVNVARLLAAGIDITERYRSWDPASLANPAEIFTFRIAFVYPLSWCFRLFGEGDATATLLGFGSALISIVVIGEIARRSISDEAGIAAALLLALLPHDIILTTRVLTDGPLRMFVAIACLFLLHGWQTGSARSFGFAGLLMGLSYLTKIVAAPLFLLLGVVPAVDALRRRSPRAFVFYVVGFASLVGVETAWYAWRTGQWFLHYRIVASAIVFKLRFEPTQFTDFGSHVRVLWEGDFLWYAPLVLGITSAGPFAGFGIHGWIWLVGMFNALRMKSASGTALAALAILLYVFVELFPVHIGFAGRRLEYELIFRQWRFASLLTPAWVPLGGGALAWLWRQNRSALVIVATAVVLSGWPQLNGLYDLLRGSQADLRAAATFVAHRQERVYTDGLALSTFEYYLGSREAAAHIRDLAALNGSLPAKGDLIVIGGSRSMEIMSDAWEKDLPAWCRVVLDADGLLPDWRVRFRVSGQHDAMRLHDLLIMEYVGS